MSAALIERLAEVIDELAALDASTWSAAELHDVLMAVERRPALASAPRSRPWWHTGAPSGAWADDGSRTCAGRLAREEHGCPSARRRPDCGAPNGWPPCRPWRGPSTPAGSHLDHVDLLGRVAAKPGFDEVEATLVDQSAALRFGDASKVVAYWAQLADEVAGGSDAPDDRSRLHAAATWRDEVVIDGVLEPIGGRIVLDELARRERDLYLANRHTARCADRRHSGVPRRSSKWRPDRRTRGSPARQAA